MARTGEKSSSFSVTCNRLSQYIKEKGGFGDLSLGMSMAQDGHRSRDKSEELRTMNLLPGMGEAPANNTVISKSIDFFPAEKKSSQMTIFYGGKVMVFDNFPAEKAKELMMVAGRGCPSSAGGTNSDGLKPPVGQQQRPQRQAMASDLPIMRKISLHRFLEKRKDRISSKAPYQVHGGNKSSSSETPAPAKKQPEETKQWLDLLS